jgi:hypothetical protein
VSWQDRAFTAGDMARQRAQRERQERERVTAAKAAEAAARAVTDRAEEAECFTLIRSSIPADRLLGYRRHLLLLCRQHSITVQRGKGSACWARREITYPVDCEDEAAVAAGYHELAHILEGQCPNAGAVHRRDASREGQWSCLACESRAWLRAQRLAPFSRAMHRELRRCLWTYEQVTPGPAKEKQELKRLSGTLAHLESRQRWVKWLQMEDDARRWKQEAARRPGR